MSELTLLIPAKYEKEALPVFLDEIKNYNYKKMIIIDTLDRETKQAIKKFNDIKIITQKKSGYGNALIEGINNCDTKYCCIINADSSMNPKYLKNMLEVCQDKDLVFGSRYIKDGGSDDDDFITFFGNKIFSFIGKVFFKIKISDILFTYIIGKTKAFQNLNLTYGDFRICVEIPISAQRKKMNYCDLPSYERSRVGGKKKVNVFKDGFLILLALINFFFYIR